MGSITLTQGQEEGVKKIKSWYNAQNIQEFKLAGYAGTGKSFMVQHTINELGLKLSEVAYCAFTGKASLVLMRYLGQDYNVSTIHRLIYEVIENELTGEIFFELKKKLFGIRLIVVDEASMVNLEILEHLKSFGISILFIGDHGQLEAIGEQANIMKNPDHKLEEIMRQLAGDPLIQLSMMAREQRPITIGNYGTSAKVISKSDMRVEDMIRADQIICGYNKTIQTTTGAIREVLGFQSDSPEVGDKVIFNRNNYGNMVDGYNIVNGMIGYIVSEPILKTHPKNYLNGMQVYEMDVQADFMETPYSKIYVPKKDILEYDKTQYNGKGRNEIERAHYGYLITCHKAQGDQFDNVYVIDESFGDEPWRWLYTAITRAKKGLILAVRQPKIYW